MQIRLARTVHWPHQRSGWRACLSCVHSAPQGTLLIDTLDEYMKNPSLALGEPWLGILHNCVDHPPGLVAARYGARQDLDLRRLVTTEPWLNNRAYCRGLFCLSRQSADFMRAHVSVPVHALQHATGRPTQLFQVEALARPFSVLFIGHWMRNFQAFFDLPTPRPRIILCVPTAFNYVLADCRIDPAVQMVPRLDDQTYDAWLAQHVVFLNLYDCTACNTVLECLVRNTPIIVNRLPALLDCLGPDYPLFYDSIDEAAQLLADTDILRCGHEYLCALDKARFYPEAFADSLHNALDCGTYL